MRAAEAAAGELCHWLGVWREKARPSPVWDLVAVACVLATVGVAVSGANAYVALPIVALFVLSVASATGPVRAILASRPMQWGGRLSYSIYLLQIPVFHILLMAHSPRWFVTSPLIVRIGLVAAYIGAVVVAAAAVHHLVEEPVRRWIVQHTRGRSHTVGPDRTDRVRASSD